MRLPRVYEQECDRLLIGRLRSNLLDEEAQVDDVRNEIDTWHERLHDALARRDYTASQLAAALERWTHGRAA